LDAVLLAQRLSGLPRDLRLRSLQRKFRWCSVAPANGTAGAPTANVEIAVSYILLFLGLAIGGYQLWLTEQPSVEAAPQPA
jgi:hypothetical protein